MSSRKPKARARQVAEFKSQAYAGSSSLDELFAREDEHRELAAQEREEARFEKACATKKRYSTRADALEAIAACEAHGRRGLSCYKCPYCNGWHLTSHPWSK